jgi:hypothetical protein
MIKTSAFALVALSLPVLVARGQAPATTIEQQLRSQYRVASVTASGAVMRTGSVLVIAADGIKANPPSGEIYWYNSHKPGAGIRYSIMVESLYSADLKSQMQMLQVGDKVLVTRIQVSPKANELVFYLQTLAQNPNDVPYRACVVFQFPTKHFVDIANLGDIQTSIGEVFTIDTSAPSEGSAPSTSSGPPPAGTSLAGVYLMRENGSRLQLNPDSSFSLVARDGSVSPGHYSVNGDNLYLTYQKTGRSSVFKIQGDRMYADTGLAWVRQGDSAPSQTPQPPPTPAALKLPAIYINAQASTDQLRLNADRSFSLGEGGQSYHGTFVDNGSTLELSISETNTKTTVTRAGDNLTDSSGQTWVLHGQPTETGYGAFLQNDDVVKMSKVGLDDATIIAKINSSRCQFNTSTNALIELKQSGVSTAVIRAMLAAGK